MFASNDYHGSFSDQGDAHVQIRDMSVLFTAPHATKHGRLGGMKEEDQFTGSLALLLAEELNASVIAASRFNPDRANVGELSADFFAALQSFAPHSGFILDVHGMSDRHEVDLCIGTGVQNLNHPPLANAIDALHEGMKDFTVATNHPFSAIAPYTITDIVASSLWETPVLQLEISRKFRVPSPDGRGEHEQFLTRLVDTLHILRALS